MDENSVPVASVSVAFRSVSSSHAGTIYTDGGGAFRLTGLPAGPYFVTLSKPGYFRLADLRVELEGGLNEILLELHHETEIHEQIEVSSQSESIAPDEADHQETLVAREIRDIPVSNSHDLRSSLSVLPGVVRDKSGEIHIAGGRAGETQIFLDGFEMGDPVTGALTARVNVDTVRAVEVDAGRYGVQYGRGGAGVLTLDTVVGDDKFRAGVTNFIPGVTLQHGLRLGNWYPRFTLSGPVRKGRAWFSDALSLQRSSRLVPELPAGANESIQWAGDNLLRAQINLTSHNLLQGSFLYNHQRDSHMGLGPFAPLSTTTNRRLRRTFVSLKDQTWSRNLIFDFGVALDYGFRSHLPLGSDPYILRPGSIAGNYFESLKQQDRRWQIIGGLIAPSRKWLGIHHLQAGFHLERVSWTHAAARNPINIEGQDGTPVQQTVFSGPASFKLSDTQIGIYFQDSWKARRFFIIQAGVRGDWDRFVRRALASPRIAVNFMPRGDESAKLSIAWGVYYQPVRLDIVGPCFDQQRTDIYFLNSAQTGVLNRVTSSFALPHEKLRLPRFYTASLEWVQRIHKSIYAGAGFSSRRGRYGLAYQLQPSIESLRLFVLQNNRRDTYRALQVFVRSTFGGKAELSAAYVRSSARSNAVLDYSLTTAVFAPQQSGPLPWDATNRLVVTGSAPAPIWDLFLSGFLELRTGFPVGMVNQQQLMPGPLGLWRFPCYFSLNLGVEKRFRALGRVWAIRLNAVNATGHENPDSVTYSAGSPGTLQFAGGQKRAFSGRIRLVG